MSIERQKGRMMVICDECGDEYENEYRPDEFQTMLEDIRSDDWLVTKLDEGWQHVCADCVRAMPTLATTK